MPLAFCFVGILSLPKHMHSGFLQFSTFPFILSIFTQKIQNILSFFFICIRLLNARFPFFNLIKLHFFKFVLNFLNII